jgi:hypothetical protein
MRVNLYVRTRGRAACATQGYHRNMTISNLAARDPLPDHEQKQAALDFLHEAWTEARLNGVDGDCMAQICLFTAFSELVSTYGEEAAARYAESLSRRISNGEFSVELARQ